MVRISNFEGIQPLQHSSADGEGANHEHIGNFCFSLTGHYPFRRNPARTFCVAEYKSGTWFT